jgi:carboxyl-terminal processing protease
MFIFSNPKHQPERSGPDLIILWQLGSGLVMWLMVVFLLSACIAGSSNTPQQPTPTLTSIPTSTEIPSPTATEIQSPFGISEEAMAYLNEALDLMQEYSINKETIEWDALRDRTYHRASGAQRISDTYQAIQHALADLGTNHSYLMTPEQVALMEDGTLVASIPGPEGRFIEGNLGYIYLPSWAGTRESADKHATAVQEIVRELDAQNPCGWILDLRENNGGAMWPMLAGIGPVLGDGLVGYAIAPDGSTDEFSYRDGQAFYNDQVETEVLGQAYYLSEPLPFVAVLTGPSTCSSGEAITIAFRGRPNTRSFGKATAGLSTGTREIELSDGAWLILAINTFADRTGQAYGYKVIPDKIVHQAGDQDDPTLQAAVAWLLLQPACNPGQ